MKNKLEKGDVVFHEYNCRWTKETNFIVSIVVRLTKTRAVLDNGTQLINELNALWNDKGFSIYGDRYSLYKLMTPDKQQQVNDFNEIQRIKKWWSQKELTNEELIKIHSLLN